MAPSFLLLRILLLLLGAGPSWGFAPSFQLSFLKFAYKPHFATPTTVLPVAADEPSTTTTISEEQLIARSFETLDFPIITTTLSKMCTTQTGKSLAADLHLAESLESAKATYDVVREVSSLPELPPIASEMDLRHVLLDLENANVLDVDQLLAVSSTLTDLANLRKWVVSDRLLEHHIPLLREMAGGIILPTLVVDALDGAFDEKRRLSETKFPQLRQLRKAAEDLERKIVGTMKTLMGSTLKDAVDGDVMERNGRFILPVKPTWKNGIGIVHGESRSARTVYVEPAAVVEPTNELQLTRSNLAREERRIITEMSRLLSKNQGPIRDALAAAADIDLMCARVKLGQRLGGLIPEVRGGGQIRLEGFRHPALLLKGDGERPDAPNRLHSQSPLEDEEMSARRRHLYEADAAAAAEDDGDDGAEGSKEVVGNDLSLDEAVPGLVLTGPNAGGKTIVLKSLGLAALFVRAGIPVPARVGSQPRVDFFETILADIGDLQSVGDDLSTFSGHLLVCKAVLERASRSTSNSLVLMDELGSGTDPAQGVAIGQAVLEALLAAGSRVALTTHYLQLKELASSDDRFEVAGMEFVDGCPTYRLKYGVVGESYALAVAERLGLPFGVVDRARDLLDDNVRKVSDLVQELEEQRDQVVQKQVELDDLTVVMREKEGAAQAKLEEAKVEFAEARAKAAQEYLVKVAQTEERMSELVKDLKALKSAELEAVAGDSLAEVRLILKEVAEEADTTPKLELTPLTNADTLEEGEPVVVLRRGVWYGVEASVTKSSRNQVEVDVGGTSVKLKKVEVSRAVADPAGDPAVAKIKPRTAAAAAAKAAGDRRRATAGQNLGISKRTAAAAAATTTKAQQLQPQPSRAQKGVKPAKSSPAVRFEANTLDLRGKTLDEAEQRIKMFISEQNLSGVKYVYLLHGHGTGKLKGGLRNWLKTGFVPGVKRYQPASASNGGDAFTQLELK